MQKAIASHSALRVHTQGVVRRATNPFIQLCHGCFAMMFVGAILFAFTGLDAITEITGKTPTVADAAAFKTWCIGIGAVLFAGGEGVLYLLTNRPTDGAINALIVAGLLLMAAGWLLVFNVI